MNDDFKLTTFQSFIDMVQLFTQQSLKEAQKLLETLGKEINSIDDIFINNNDELFEILPDGTLVKINLYIATKETTLENIQNYQNNDDLDVGYKYHIYKCQTLVNMFNQNKKHRYKINTRDNETFYYTFSDYYSKKIFAKENQKIKICINCLKKYNSQYATSYTENKFNLKEHHTRRNFFHPSFNTDDFEYGEYALPNTYSSNWSTISQQLKNKKNYTCEKCGYFPSSLKEKKFIHTHHINGDKTNNCFDNLKVLCIKCHSEEHLHSHIKNTHDYIEFNMLRTTPYGAILS